MVERRDIRVGDPIPERSFTPTNVSLFLYNAAIWNPHRIHYDETYTREVEKHPGVVIDGPLQGDWLGQAAEEWIEEHAPGAVLAELSYSNRLACHLGETLTVGGTVAEVAGDEVSLELYVRNEAGDVTTPGRARVRLGA